jgi:hypothetical protein
MDIIKAINDDKLFKPCFKNPQGWQAWRAFLSTLFGLEMTSKQTKIFRQCTKRQKPPKKPACEAWLVVGRRGGKSFISALVAVFLACFYDYSKYLSRGERGTVMIIAQDRRQARVLKQYISAFLNGIELLKMMVAKETGEAIEIVNGINIEIATANFRAVRGYTVVACLCDEIAFWRSENSSNPDFEILDAIRPGMATIPNAMLICLSSPYAKRGALYEAYRRYFGKDNDVLIWQADTRIMNPTVSQKVIDRAYERDPVSAQAEYGAQFRQDIESFVTRESVESVLIPGRYEIPPIVGVRYFAFVDPSGGSRDSFTLGIAHEENSKKILDTIRERKPPFSPDEVCQEFAVLMKSYCLREVTGDRYAGQWPRERFQRYGITYKTSEKTKSQLYQDFLPMLNSGQCELLDNQKLINQIVNLERRTSRGGRDIIDHPPGAHDDLANVVAGVFCSEKRLKRAGTW